MPLPDALETIVEDFHDAPNNLRIEMLFEYSEQLPELPEGMETEGMEQVTECQSPFFLEAEVDAEADRVRLWFDCPPEAPTTRGFAGILAAGLSDATPREVLDVEQDFYLRMGLGEAISPLRLRGMSAILARLQRQVRGAA